MLQPLLPSISLHSQCLCWLHQDVNSSMQSSNITSHKKVCQTQTSTCRDEILKNQPNKTGMTPQYFYTIPTSCAILPTVHNTKPSTFLIISLPATKNEHSTSLHLTISQNNPSFTKHYKITTAHFTATCIQDNPYLSF